MITFVSRTTTGSGFTIKCSLKLLQLLFGRTRSFDRIAQTIHRGKGTVAPSLSKLSKLSFADQRRDELLPLLNDDEVVPNRA